MIDPIANNEVGVSVRGKLNDMVDVVNSVSDVEASIAPIVHYHGITGLTGGGALNLDGIATVDMDVGVVVAITIGSNVTSFYRLISSTTAESSPFFIRPDDYAGTTNEKVWRLASFAVNGLTCRASFQILETGGGVVIAMGSDGSAIFAGRVSNSTGYTPSDPTDYTTKAYVDAAAGVGAQGSGSPEGVVTAAPCKIYRNADTGALWWKVSGTGNTGWEQMTGPF